jgi:signal transduction histidine kinase
VREFGLADGLPSTSGIRRDHSVAKDALGRIWFSLQGGLCVVNPSLPSARAPALVKVESVAIDGQPLTESDARYASDRRRVVFSFIGVSLTVPGRVRYRYRLDGYDSDWSPPTESREAAYNSLSPARYTFRVMASNSEGLWNGPAASVPLEVEPQLSQTLWFRVTGLCLATAAIFAGFRYRLARIHTAMNLRFEERLAERTRIARELHDTLLQSFQGLLFEFQAARNLFHRRPEEALRTLDDAIGSAKAAITEGRDAIQNLRSGSADHTDLAQLLATAGKELSDAQDSNVSGAVFRLTVEGPPQTLSPVIQDEVYRIGREILRNAFRHARAAKIEVEIRYDDRLLRLRIRDDGIGIDPKVLGEGACAGHWGLPGVRERAKLVGAKLDFWSEAGAGTEVQLIVPASVAYPKSPDARVFGLFRKTTRSHAE